LDSANFSIDFVFNMNKIGLNGFIGLLD